MKATLSSLRFWVQLALTAGFLVLLAWRVDISAALATIPDANWLWALPALLIFTASKAVHTQRWRIFMNRPDIPFSSLFGIFLVHNMANAVLLLRAGDVLRIQTTSQRHNIPRSELTATVIVVETLLDGFAFIILIALAFTFGAMPVVLRGTFWGVAGLALIGLVLGIAGANWFRAEALQRFYPFRWLSTDARAGVITLVRQFLDGMRVLRNTNLAIPACALSLAGWLLEACSYWFFGIAFGIDLSFPQYMLVMMTANFAVSIPLTPSGIGPYEIATQEVMQQMGVAAATATGFAIGVHLAFICWITLTGLVAMWATRLSPGEIFYIEQRREEPEPQPGAT